jgi:hypothetical protein
LEAEAGLLACLIMDGGADVMADCLSQRLTPESFFHPNTRLFLMRS